MMFSGQAGSCLFGEEFRKTMTPDASGSSGCPHALMITVPGRTAGGWVLLKAAEIWAVFTKS